MRKERRIITLLLSITLAFGLGFLFSSCKDKDKDASVESSSNAGSNESSDVCDESQHVWNDGVVTTNPTCTADGVKTYTCTVCNTASYTEPVETAGHSHTPTVTAPTCTEQGYTTYTCAPCGDSYVTDYTEASGHGEMEEKTITLAEYGTCGVGGILYEQCVDCEAKLGGNALFSACETTSFAVTEDGFNIVCHECDFLVTMNAVKGACESLFVCDVTVGDETVLEGLQVSQSGHSDKGQFIDLTEIFGVESFIYIDGCETCDKAEKVRVEHSGTLTESQTEYTEDGIDYVKTTKTCADCGFISVTLDYQMVDGCAVATMQRISVYNGEELLHSFLIENKQEPEHTMQQRTVFLGEERNCNEGVFFVEECTDCGEQDVRFSQVHSDEEETVTVGVEGCCTDSFIRERCSLCDALNSYHIMSFDCAFEYAKEREETDENGIVHTYFVDECADCELVAEEERYSFAEGCEVTGVVISRLIYGETILHEQYEYYDIPYKATHSYGDIEYIMINGNCENGVLERSVCEKCGDVKAYAHEDGHFYVEQESIEIKVDNAECCGLVETVGVCACGDTKRSVRANCEMEYVSDTEEETEDGWVQVTTYKCRDCELQHIVRDFSVEENCETSLYQRGTWMMNGVVIYEEESSFAYSYESHDTERKYYMFGESCEDGVLTLESCVNCDWNFVEEVDYHIRRAGETLHLEDYGACEGTVILSKCLCERESYLEINNSCDITRTQTNSPQDEYENWDELYTFTCSNCDFYHEENYYFVYEGCTYNRYKSQMVKVGETVIAETLEVWTNDEIHIIQEIYQSYDGCNYGVVNQTCKKCGATVDEYEYYGCYSQVVKSVELDCGQFTEYNCVCGDLHNYELEHSCGYQTTMADQTIDGVSYQISTYTYDCGIVIVARETDTLDGCTKYKITTESVSFNGEILTENIIKASYIGMNHDMVYEYDMLGATCDEGVIMSYNCTRCDDASGSETIYEHLTKMIVEKFEYVYEDGCGLHTVIVGKCGCLKEISVEMDPYAIDWDEYKECFDCDFTVWKKVTYEGSHDVTVTTQYWVEMDGAIEVIVTHSITMVKHSYRLRVEDGDYGNITAIVACGSNGCGKSVSHEVAHLGTQESYELDFITTKGGQYTFYSISEIDPDAELWYYDESTQEYVQESGDFRFGNFHFTCELRAGVLYKLKINAYEITGDVAIGAVEGKFVSCSNDCDGTVLTITFYNGVKVSYCTTCTTVKEYTPAE